MPLFIAVGHGDSLTDCQGHGAVRAARRQDIAVSPKDGRLVPPRIGIVFLVVAVIDFRGYDEAVVPGQFRRMEDELRIFILDRKSVV